jgi:hypothetical protein
MRDGSERTRRKLLEDGKKVTAAAIVGGLGGCSGQGDEEVEETDTETYSEEQADSKDSDSRDGNRSDEGADSKENQSRGDNSYDGFVVNSEHMGDPSLWHELGLMGSEEGVGGTLHFDLRGEKDKKVAGLEAWRYTSLLINEVENTAQGTDNLHAFISDPTSTSAMTVEDGEDLVSEAERYGTILVNGIEAQILGFGDQYGELTDQYGASLHMPAMAKLGLYIKGDDFDVVSFLGRGDSEVDPEGELAQKALEREAKDLEGRDTLAQNPEYEDTMKRLSRETDGEIYFSLLGSEEDYDEAYAVTLDDGMARFYELNIDDVPEEIASTEV